MGLRTRIIVAAVVVSGIINLALCLYISCRVKNFELDRFNAHIDKSAYAMRVINTLPLYNVDIKSLQTNMATFFEDENMKSITLHDSQAGINIHLERQLPLGGTDINKSFLIDHNGLKLGRFTIVYSTGLIEKQASGFLVKMLGATFAAVLFTAAIFTFVINKITEPLARLVSISSQLAAGDFDKDLKLRGGGEVGTLSRNVMKLGDTITEKINEAARINVVLEGAVAQRSQQEKKNLHHKRVISSVETFFQRAGNAQSERQIAQIFIQVVQAVIPGPYCFVGQVCDKKNYLDILAICDQAEKQCQLPGENFAEHGCRQHISGRLVKTIVDKAPVISNNVSENPEFSFLPDKHLPINTIMSIPMLHGRDVLGLVAFANKEGGYTHEDQAIAGMMVAALAEALTLKREQDGKKQLENTLIQSEKMVSMGSLAMGMTHKLNCQLARIRQYSQMLRISIEPAASEQLTGAGQYGLNLNALDHYLNDQGVFNNLSLIMAAEKKASRMVSNLLSFSGTAGTDFAVEDLSLILDQAIELAANEFSFATAFNFSDIQMMKDYDPGWSQVKCRAGELKQVFFNILLNGADAMADDGTGNPCPTFFMRIYGKSDQVCVEIRDNGPGMPEDIRRHIFEPFFTTKPDKEGTGLGLSVCDYIIGQNHNGFIEVASAPGQGSCVRILLPKG